MIKPITPCCILITDFSDHYPGLLHWGEGTAGLASRCDGDYWNHSTPAHAAPLPKETGTTDPLSHTAALIGITPRDCGIFLSPLEKADTKTGRKASI